MNMIVKCFRNGWMLFGRCYLRFGSKVVFWVSRCRCCEVRWLIWSCSGWRLRVSYNSYGRCCGSGRRVRL